MHHDLTTLWKSTAPRFVVVLDAELAYDHEAHGRYQASERFLPADAANLSLRELRTDPRVTPRWPCHRITTLSWLVMTEAEDGLRPVRLESRRSDARHRIARFGFYTRRGQLRRRDTDGGGEGGGINVASLVGV
ncbi:hypothetical protein [uncultured Sphingomonas sp.]|uniref:hypothetical protein n=1 Tax=uncultured Sphingomonas sp. TaxID=158754 RepID=UPI0025E62462|nr:hypothetical protein [uncultured Sphingomonas sp.]